VKKFLLAGLAFGALVLPAAAADMPVKAPLPVVPIDIWTGGYVGVNVGYGWARDHIDSIGSPGNCTWVLLPACGPVGAPKNLVGIVGSQAASFETSLDRRGIIYGGQWGHNWLLHNIAWTWDGVVGVEVDFQGVSDSHSATFTSGAALPGFPANALTQTVTLTEKLSNIGTLRGRAGLLWGPNTLIYVTGGLAFANAQATSAYSQNLTGPVVGGAVPFPGAGGLTQELFGPTIGGGIEWKWTANWSVKAEYLYADLGNMVVNTNAFNVVQVTTGLTGSSVTAQTSSHFHENIARVGINYRFW
jgi:outer membrane immunogenic protein